MWYVASNLTFTLSFSFVCFSFSKRFAECSLKDLKNWTCVIFSLERKQMKLFMSSSSLMQKAASEWPYSLPVFLPQPPLTDADRVPQWGIKHLEELSQHGYGAAGSAHLLPGNTLLWKVIRDKMFELVTLWKNSIKLLHHIRQSYSTGIVLIGKLFIHKTIIVLKAVLIFDY